MKLNILTLTITLAAAGSIFAAVQYNDLQVIAKEAESREQLQAFRAEIVRPNVAVTRVTEGNYQAQVTGYGEVKAHHEINLTAQVSGRIDSLDAHFASGGEFKSGETLVKINDIAYRQAVAEAQASVASANLALLEEQRQGKQALLEWQRSGMEGQPDSLLVLRKPQLDAAKATLANAQQQLTKAQYDLDNTVVTAPFSALVVSKAVQPGSYVQSGSDIATLYSTDLVEVTISLSEQQWASLPNSKELINSRWPVRLTGISVDRQWQGYVARVEQHVNAKDRQRALVIAVDKPLTQSTPLYPGSFVTATLQGQKLANLWQLPASAISQNGDVWYVDKQQTLAKFPAQKVFSQGKFTYITPKPDVNAADIVVHPLTSYSQGMQVNMVRAELKQPQYAADVQAKGGRG